MENTYTQLAYLDADFNFVRVNSAYALSAGLSKEELIGHNHFDLFPNRETQTAFEWARDNGQAVEFYARPFEFSEQPRQGSTYWDWTLVPVKDGEGRVQNLVLSLLDVSERVQARRERESLLAENRQQRHLLEQLVAAAPIGIAVVGGADPRYELVNPYYQAIPGMSGVPTPGKRVAEVFPDAAGWGTPDVLEKVYRTGQAASLREQTVLTGPTQEQTYWNAEYVPLRNGGKSADKVLILISDVTESIAIRHQVEELAAAAQRQAEELATIFEAMSDGVIVYDAAGIAQRANAAAITLFGLDPVGVDRDQIGQKMTKCYLDGNPVAIEDLPSSRALRGERAMNEKLRLTRPTGACVTALVSSAPLFSEGLVSGAILVWHDITAREEAEEMRNRLIAILEQTPDVISTSSVDGSLLYLNRAGREILGLAEGSDLPPKR
jgi:PAS domain S-box-containing protein